MVLEIPQPYDFELSATRFRDHGSDRATVWHEGGLHRVVAGREIRIEPAPGGVRVDPWSTEAEAEARHLLGLSLELEPFLAWARGDAVLGRLAHALTGFRPMLNPQPFEALAIAITAQQISLRAAAAIRGRLVERFGVRHERAWSFPERERIARLRPRELLVLGFSGRKAEYLIELAGSDLDLDALASLPDDAVIAAITSLHGLGRWTADWFLARHLARPTAWPAGDLGVRKAVSAFYAGGAILATEEVRSMGARFAPFQNLTAHYLLAGARMAG